LSCNDIKVELDFQHKFRKALEYSEIQTLILKDNKLGNEGISVIANGLRAKSFLSKLDVSNCGFNLNGGDQLLTAISRSSTIKEVKLDHNNLAPGRSSLILQSFFTKDRSLTRISMSSCKIGQNGGI